LNAAGAITATTDVTVALAATIDAATNTGANSYQIVDTAANVLAASAALLGTDATIVVNDTSMSADTATQLAALDAANNGVAGGPNFTIAGSGGVGVFTLSDTFTNLTAAANAAVVAAATNLTATGTMTVAQANTLRTAAAAPGEPTYSLSDTYANLATGGTTTTDAVNLTVTNNVTAAQAVNVVNTLGGAAGAETYTIRDTASGVATVANTNGAVVSGATSVTVTSAATVAQAGFLSELSNLSGGYTVSDTSANVVAALWTVNGANAADRATLLGATSITVTGNASVAEALGVAGAGRGLYTLGAKVSYAVQDTAAAIITGLGGIDSAGLTAASAITLNAENVTVNQGVTLTALSNFRGFDHDSNAATAGVYSISDSAANVQNADGTLINGARLVTANGTVGNDVIDFSAFGRGVNVDAGTGNDFVQGTESADVITGGAGVDALTGGSGADSFNFAGGDTGLTFAARDIIQDLGGTDVIRSAAGGGAAYAEADGTAIDFAAFVVAADAALGGAVRIFTAYNFNASGNALVAIDVDGDGTFNNNDLLIELVGVNLETEVGAGNFGGP